jgi:alkanesulfonate monooxygenase
MPVEFIGFLGTQEDSEISPSSEPVIDTDYARSVALAHEAGGFDRVHIAQSGASPDAVVTATQVFADTKKLGVLLAHRPGLVAPTLAARTLATLDHVSKGRMAVHIITGSDDADQRCDGDHLDHSQRYERTAEYLDIIKRIWSSDPPIDHAGRHYRVSGAYSSVKPLQKPHLPIHFSGSSADAIRVAARYADVYALSGESLAQVADTIARVRTAAAAHGRADHIRFSLSLRPILGRTEQDAWARAKGKPTSLVGTPDQVVESLLTYHDLGVRTFIIRGFKPLIDAIEYGREIIPRVRAEIMRRDLSTWVDRRAPKRVNVAH